ncbi:MAG: hypothetical protein ABIP13_02270 [Tepidiformaceae bacterium]
MPAASAPEEELTGTPPLPAIARSASAPELTAMELAAPANRDVEGDLLIAASSADLSGGPGRASPEVAAPSGTAPTGSAARSHETAQRQAADGASPPESAPAAPASVNLMGDALVMELASSPGQTAPGTEAVITSDSSASTAPGPVQRSAVAPSQGDTDLPTVPALATPGGAEPRRDHLRMDLASPTAADAQEAAALARVDGETPSSETGGGQESASRFVPVIARAVATPAAGRPGIELPLSSRAAETTTNGRGATTAPGTRRAMARSTSEGSAPEAGLLSRATGFVPAGEDTNDGATGALELATTLEGGRGFSELNRSIAGATATAGSLGGSAALDQPLFARSHGAAAGSTSPTPNVARAVASPEAHQSLAVQRSPEMPLNVEGPDEGVQRTLREDEAFGAITSVEQNDDRPTNDSGISEDDLEQITEHVWQFVRKELRVERERQRGQA